MKKKIKVLLLCAFLTVGINSECAELKAVEQDGKCSIRYQIGDKMVTFIWKCDGKNVRCGVCEDDDSPVCRFKDEQKYRYKCCSWKLSFHGCDGTFYGEMVDIIKYLLVYQGMSK